MGLLASFDKLNFIRRDHVINFFSIVSGICIRDVDYARPGLVLVRNFIFQMTGSKKVRLIYSTHQLQMIIVFPYEVTNKMLELNFRSQQEGECQKQNGFYLNM